MAIEKNVALNGSGTSEAVLRDVLTALAEGIIDRAINHFSEQFAFNDYGIGLEFRDKEQLTEFFQKERELYPDAVRPPDAVFVSGNHVSAEWTLRFTVTEPLFGGQYRKLPICVHGSSIVQIEDGEITRWSDYYDGLSSRRTGLASHFTEWIEL
jgi:ketosteroid isomerase-like protein